MSASETFRSHLREALEVWRRCPWLPMTSGALGLALWAATEVTTPVRAVLALLVAAVWLAWLGLERVVYDRVWTSGRVPFRELAELAPSLAGRFLRLGLLVGVPLLGITTLVSATVPESVAGAISAVLGVALLMALTFVTPALVFDEPRVMNALATGGTMVVSEWREARWHIVVPAVALTALGAPSALTADTLVGAGGVVAAALLGLLAKGAVLAYYRRQRDPDDGHAPTSAGVAGDRTD